MTFLVQLNQKSGEFVEKASSLLALMGPEFSRMVDPKQFNLFDPKFEESFLKTYKVRWAGVLVTFHNDLKVSLQPGLLYCKKKSNEMVHEVRAEIIEINKTITQVLPLPPLCLLFRSAIIATVSVGRRITSEHGGSGRS